VAYHLDDTSLDGATSKPSRSAGGARRYFRDENAALGLDGTEVPAWILEMLVGEVVGTVEAAGITPDKSNDAQLAAAIAVLARPRGMIQVKGGDYTAVAADLGTTLRFTAAGTLSLAAAATLANGWWVRVINDAASGNVTIDPAGSETLDGLATRTLTPGSRAVIASDGSIFRTLQGRWLWDSGELAITAASGDTLSHSLSRLPTRTWPVLKCVGAEHGHGSGDEVEFNPAGSNASNAGLVLTPGAAAVKYRIGSGGLQLPNGTTGVTSTLTAGNWRLIIRAEEVC